MPAKDQRLYLIHIRDCCGRILEYTDGIEATWPTVPLVHDAVCRNLEIMGEAARKVDEAFRAAYPEIPWRSMTDVRNILIHTYDRVSPDILVDIVRRDIPPLLASVNRILDEEQE
jgi:uncharacterized protein with HEPN domain